MSGKDYKRKTYVINRHLQFRMIATFLLSVLGALVLFSLAIMAYYWISTQTGDRPMDEYIKIYSRVEAGTGADGEALHKTVESLSNRWKLIIPPILINNAFIMLVIAVIGVFYSHRIAGPVYRIKADIEKVLAGDKDVRIVLRKNDKLHDLSDSVNLLLEELQKSRQG
jgi:methyl-accepting chemotaxis protein